MHPGVVELCARYNVHVPHDYPAVTLTFHLCRKERRYVVVMFTPVEGDQDVITMSCSVNARRPVIGQARVDSYLRTLANVVHARTNAQIMLSQPCGLSIYGMIGSESFADEYRHLGWAEAANILMWRYIMLIRTASVMVDLNHRLYDRRGTEGYKKLLPSRLVALTLCGLIGNATVN